MFLGADKLKDPDQLKYLDVLFDFSYLRDPEEAEKSINASQELADIDSEFQENHQVIHSYHI